MNGRKFDFSEEGATLNVPEQRIKLRPVKRPKGDLKDMKSRSGGFKPWRLVINFEMEDEENPGSYISEFEKPLVLRVRYTRGDIEKAAKDGKPLRIGFWDGSDWVVFTEEKHNFIREPDTDGKSGGEMVVYLSKWADPPIGIGI